MNVLRRALVGPVRGIVAVACLLAVACNASAQVPFGQGTHAFRRILFDLKLQPLHSASELKDPRHTLLIVLGETNVFDELPASLVDFLQDGGAVLIATDRATAWRHLERDFGFRVSGAPVQHLESDLLPNYRNLAECPFLVSVASASPALLGTLPGHGGYRLRRVATNRPSFLSGRSTFPGLERLVYLPPGCLSGEGRGMVMHIFPLSFAIGGPVGEGRLLVLADHSIFINDMMLQDDNDNIDFTYNCLDWLLAGKEPCSHVLLYDEGQVNSQLDIPLKEVPPQLPPESVVVPLANKLLTDLEKDDAFNAALLNWKPWETLKVVLVLLLTAALAFYGFYRLIRARHRFEFWAPLLDLVLARQTPAANVLEQRHRALLGKGNLWEPARALARESLAAAGVPAGGAEPHFEATGNWWQRQTLTRLARRVWRLAHGERPQPVSPREFTRLVGELEEVRAALAAGVLRCQLEEKRGASVEGARA